MHPITFIQYQVYTNNLSPFYSIIYCAARLFLSRFIFTLKKLCRTMTYILSNISNPNITFAENRHFLQNMAQKNPFSPALPL